MNKPLTNLQARDLDSVIHPYSPLHKLKDTGVTIFGEGKGVFVYDSQGKEYIEGMAGLWCTGLGFGNEELVEAATEQLRALPYYHQFSGKGTEPAIALSEKLKELAPCPIDKVMFTSSGVGGQRHADQARLVLQQCDGAARQEEDHLAGSKLITA